MIVSILDRLHERKIARLRDACTDAFRSSDAAACQRAWDQLKAALAERSPEQVQQLERARGLG